MQTSTSRMRSPRPRESAVPALRLVPGYRRPERAGSPYGDFWRCATGTWYRGFFAHLDIGVTMFFVISGFLLYRPMVASRILGVPATRTRDYARRRFLRIVPAYWLALTVLGIFPGLYGVFSGNWWVYYGLLQNYPIYTKDTGCATHLIGCGIDRPGPCRRARPRSRRHTPCPRARSADRFDWRPHPKSFSAGQLAQHIAAIPGNMSRSPPWTSSTSPAARRTMPNARASPRSWRRSTPR